MAKFQLICVLYTNLTGKNDIIPKVLKNKIMSKISYQHY